ncbi:PEP-CTERM sorting domain-containing protein [Pirellulaceae bacterium SH467]
MKFLLVLVSVIFVLLTCETSRAAFVTSASSNLKFAVLSPEITMSNFFVNKFDGGALFTSTSNLAGSQASGYTTTIAGTKTFKAIVFAPTNISEFSFSVAGNVVGVVASNRWTGGGGTMLGNVWGQFSPYQGALDSALASINVVGVNNSFFNGNSSDQANRGFEIHRGNQTSSDNPDRLSRIGNAFTGAAKNPTNFVSVNWNASELFMVLVEVPEPATMALWGMGAVGLAAFRFRRRK